MPAREMTVCAVAVGCAARRGDEGAPVGDTARRGGWNSGWCRKGEARQPTPLAGAPKGMPPAGGRGPWQTAKGGTEREAGAAQGNGRGMAGGRSTVCAW